VTPAVRVGQGVDVHPLSDDPARPLVLGGMRIPGAAGLAGHSDADALLHAVVDALLGAAGLGDIGALFGSEDPDYAGADSQVFLAGALAQVVEHGWAVGNVDVTIVAQRPRLAPYREGIARSLATLLGVPAAAVNVKATTSDGLGFTGRGEGIACLAIVLLEAR
jgi:2-C-methyl-D-erythritol 2,4-cyclodiphosphate synthase